MERVTELGRQRMAEGPGDSPIFWLIKLSPECIRFAWDLGGSPQSRTGVAQKPQNAKSNGISAVIVSLQLSLANCGQIF